MRPRLVSVGFLAAVWMIILTTPGHAQGDGPLASFSHDPAAPRAGDEVRFNDTSMSPGRNVTSWSWDFGDGGRSVEQNPRHVFVHAGTFVVTLTVTDDAGSSGTDHDTLVVGATATASALLPRWLYWTMPLIVSTLLFAIGFLVFARGQPTIYNRVFFLLTSASAIKGYTESLLYFLDEHNGSGSLFDVIAVINRLIAFLYAPIFLWFVLVFPRPIRPWLKNGMRGAWSLLLALPFAANLFLGLVPAATMQNVFNVYVSLLALAALGLLVYHAWETDSAEERHRLRLLSATFFLLVFSTIMVSALQLAATQAALDDHAGLQATYEGLSDTFGTVVAPFLEIVGQVLVMYGILRYQLLGVDLLVKRITRTSIFALSIGTVFVIVSNSVEQVFQVTVLHGVKLDFIIAGFISAVLLYPVQKGAERIANRLFPQAGSHQPDHLSQRRMEIYEAQLRYALLDGQLKEKELNMLAALKESLELKSDELQRVVALFPGFDPTPLGVKRAPVARPAMAR